jgi:SAM-dependent methyltransferase
MAIMSWVEEIAGRVSAHNRRRKWQLFLDTVRPTQELRVLDVGYTGPEYSPRDNYIEKYYPYPARLTALGVDDPAGFRARYPGVKVVQYGGGPFPFGDASFDAGWSNAVLEHVGDRDAQRLFLQEMYRVCRVALVTTPNRLFPVEVHTRLPLLHWLPARMFERVLRWTGKAWAGGNYMRLLSRRELGQLLREAGISRYRIVRDRFMLFTMDFVVILTH